MMMASLGGTPQTTMYVGDSPSDMKAARDAGVYAVAVTWGYHDREDFEAPNMDAAVQPNVIVDTPEQILTLTPADADA